MNNLNIKRPPLTAFLLAGVLAVVSRSAVAADPDRGRMLHDTHCVSCHDSKIYKRDSKLGTDYETIRTQVVRWQNNVALHWNDSDIDAVTTYLGRTFYKVPCPVC
ncbi:MAG TPA: cytochrome c [Burkholderiales bacterium]